MSERLEEAVIKWVLDADDCLLMIESLKEDSLMEDEMHSFRGVGDRNHRQGNFSTSAILYSAEQCTHLDSSLLHVGSISSKIIHWHCTTQGAYMKL